MNGRPVYGKFETEWRWLKKTVAALWILSIIAFLFLSAALCRTNAIIEALEQRVESSPQDRR